MVRSGYLIVLMFVLLMAVAFRYQTVALVCPVPVQYRIGTIDEGFAITESEAKAALLDAEAVWETAIGRNLFVYDDEASFTVNFVFDERQETANAEERYRAALDAAAERNVELTEEYESLVAQYEALQTKYETAAASYEVKLERHNQTVAQYNEQGGAPQEVFDELESERTSLERERRELNGLVNSLNTLVDEINDLGAAGNELVNEYNHDVSEYNEQFGGGEAFTQGDYQGRFINIYTFKDTEELVTVLAHEFGHALSLGHVDGAESVMYYLMGEQPTELTLSATDVAEYQQICVEEKRLFGFIQL